MENQESKFENAMKQCLRRTTKWVNYFELYDRIIKELPNDPCVVEIGIANGGSLETWRELFPKPARIIGIDLNPRTAGLCTEGFEIKILDTGKVQTWNVLMDEYSGQVDLLVDDGGHTNLQQILTIIHGVKLVRPGGWVVIEDLHASVSKEFGNPSRYSTIGFLNELNLDLHRIHQRSDERPRFPAVSNHIEMIIQSCSWAALKISEPKVQGDYFEVSYGSDSSLMDFDHRWDSIVIPRKLKSLVPRYARVALRNTVLKFSNFLVVSPLLRNLRNQKG